VRWSCQRTGALKEKHFGDDELRARRYHAKVKGSQLFIRPVEEAPPAAPRFEAALDNARARKFAEVAAVAQQEPTEAELRKVFA
jgi:hypothetical protein